VVRVDLVALLATMLCACPAKAIDLRGTIWERAAAEVGVDPVLCYAVGLVESSRFDAQSKLVSPWPWAIRHGQGSLLAHSAIEARSALLAAKGRGETNIDVGLMQINVRANGHRVADLEMLLDPTTNIRIGAQILHEAIASSPADLELGVGRYHSWKPGLARAYGHAVLVTYGRLRYLGQVGGAYGLDR